MGFDPFIASNNNTGKASNTCAYNSFGNKAFTYKTDENGVTTKYTNGIFGEQEKISSFEAAQDGTITEYRDLSNDKCKLAEYKTDENGITRKYDEKGKQCTNTWWRTDEKGVTKEYNRSGEVVHTYKPGPDGVVTDYNKYGNKVGTFEACDDKEAGRVDTIIEEYKAPTSIIDLYNNIKNR